MSKKIKNLTRHIEGDTNVSNIDEKLVERMVDKSMKIGWADMALNTKKLEDLLTEKRANDALKQKVVTSCFTPSSGINLDIAEAVLLVEPGGGNIATTTYHTTTSRYNTHLAHKGRDGSACKCTIVKIMHLPAV